MTESQSHPFPYESLDVYCVTLEYIALLDPICDSLPKGEADTRSQLKRASLSILNNICEGSGRWSRRDKSHFYAIARGSALECAGALTWLQTRRIGDRQSADQAVSLLRRIGAMLTGMVKWGQPG